MGAFLAEDAFSLGASGQLLGSLEGLTLEGGALAGAGLAELFLLVGDSPDLESPFLESVLGEDAFSVGSSGLMLGSLEGVTLDGGALGGGALDELALLAGESLDLESFFALDVLVMLWRCIMLMYNL